MVFQVATSDLGSDALGRGVRVLIRNKGAFSKGSFSLPVRIANKCKLIVYHRFAKVSAKSLNRKPKAFPQQTRVGARKGAEAKKRALRDGIWLPDTFAMHCFAAFYVVIILSLRTFY